MRPGQARQRVGFLFDAGYPGYSRGAAPAGPGEFIVTTANGDVARFWPAQQRSEVLARGFDQLYGVAIAPRGAVVFAEQGAGRVHAVQSGNVEVLASGLKQPCGVAIGADDACFVSEAAGGRVVRLSGGKSQTVLDGLLKPHGIAVRGETLYILDVGAKQLIECDLAGRSRRTIAADFRSALRRRHPQSAGSGWDDVRTDGSLRRPRGRTGRDALRVGGRGRQDSGDPPAPHRVPKSLRQRSCTSERAVSRRAPALRRLRGVINAAAARIAIELHCCVLALYFPSAPVI